MVHEACFTFTQLPPLTIEPATIYFGSCNAITVLVVTHENPKTDACRSLSFLPNISMYVPCSMAPIDPLYLVGLEVL